MKSNKKKRSSLKFSPTFRPNLGASLKETHKTYPLCDQSFCSTCKGGEGACRNFAYYSTLIIRSWLPKEGHGPMPSPLNTPLIGPKIILLLQKNSKFSSSSTTNFWLRTGNVATFQWLEKNEAALCCNSFKTLSA